MFNRTYAGRDLTICCGLPRAGYSSGSAACVDPCMHASTNLMRGARADVALEKLEKEMELENSKTYGGATMDRLVDGQPTLAHVHKDVRAYHGNRAGLRHHLLDGLQLRLLHVALPRTNISWHVAAKRCCVMLASKHARKQARRLASPASWPVCRPTSNQHAAQTTCPPASAHPPVRPPFPFRLPASARPPAPFRLPASACPPARPPTCPPVHLPACPVER